VTPKNGLKKTQIKIFQYSKEFQVESVFQGKRKLLKNPEW